MGDEFKSAVENLTNVWESELKPRIEQMESESKSSGEATAETKAAIDRVQDRMDQIEAQAQLAGKSAERKAGEMDPEVKAAYRTWFGHGDEGLSAEQKVLTIRDEATGGVLAPPDFIASVVQGVIQFSPIRALATVRQTSRTSIQFPKRTGNFAAAWTTETGTRSETTGRTYGLEEIPTHELYARVLISNWDLEDPIVDLESIISADMSEQFGVSEGTAFVSGNGVGKPSGLLNDPTVVAAYTPNGNTAFVAGAATGVTGADGIIAQTFAIKEQYWPNARFVMNRFTLQALRVLKDQQGNYLWQIDPGGFHGVSSGLPATLYGYPYTIALDMPNVASNSLPVIFGDFSKAYWIADRVEISYLRDPYSQASAGAVVLHARKRVGGQVVLPEAVNVLKMAVS